jgi:hypothetical protein
MFPTPVPHLFTNPRGDLPYKATQAVVGIPNLIQDMNREDLAFTIYDGDW